MRTSALISLLLASLIAAAQNYDILERAPATAIYVETAYEGNDDLHNCDWHTSVSDFLGADFDDQSLFGRECAINIRMRGIINREGADIFRHLVDRLEKAGHRPAAIVLNSKGGDADAAIAIARTIRNNPIFASVSGGVETRIDVDPAATCFSACVVIFTAGYRRVVEFRINNDPNLPSRLGIHGPGHFDESSSSYDTSASNAQLVRISKALKSYFGSIDISESIVDDMFAVPFDEIRLLNQEDLANYGIAVN